MAQAPVACFPEFETAARIPTYFLYLLSVRDGSAYLTWDDLMPMARIVLYRALLAFCVGTHSLMIFDQDVKARTLDAANDSQIFYWCYS